VTIVSGEPDRRRRVADPTVGLLGERVAVQGERIETHGLEIEKFRKFKHETNNSVQELIGKVSAMAEDLKVIVNLSERLAEVEQEQATHTVACDGRYKSIVEYMADSKDDRAAIRLQQTATDKKISDGSNRVLLALLVAAVSIIGAFLWRFGLPPMGN
jgi:hypothetical protein